MPRAVGNPRGGQHWVPGGGHCPLSLHGCGRQRQQCLHNGPGARAAGTDAPAPSPRRRSGSGAQAARTHCWNTAGLPPPRGAAYTGGSAACAPTLYLQVRRAGRPGRYNGREHLTMPMRTVGSGPATLNAVGAVNPAHLRALLAPRLAVRVSGSQLGGKRGSEALGAQCYNLTWRAPPVAAPALPDTAPAHASTHTLAPGSLCQGPDAHATPRTTTCRGATACVGASLGLCMLQGWSQGGAAGPMRAASCVPQP